MSMPEVDNYISEEYTKETRKRKGRSASPTSKRQIAKQIIEEMCAKNYHRDNILNYLETLFGGSRKSLQTYYYTFRPASRADPRYARSGQKVPTVGPEVEVKTPWFEDADPFSPEIHPDDEDPLSLTRSY